MTDDSRFDRLELARGERPDPPRRGLAPGDPQQMPDQLRLHLGPLFIDPQLTVRQHREPLEMLLGWQQANRYEVSSAEGRTLFWAAEQSGGVLRSLSRNFNPFYRNTTDCLTPDGTVALRITFPFTWFFRRGEVTAWDGRPLGFTQQRFSLLRTWVDVLGVNDNLLLEISGPMLKFFSFAPWVFEVKQHGRLVARIRKHWSGWFQEMFSKADNFTIDFEPGFTDTRLRQLLVAAALTIDLVSFEQKNRNSSGANLIGNLFD